MYFVANYLVFFSVVFLLRTCEWRACGLSK